ncbi:hypothetical protein EYF80_046652 [Liparis tanakae]|uniref:Uncharacterized protein n=1 Tax=Liparis tanakae TaxID=230148 RepID=A0A4Z2FPL5_9TELE|nr:hypothetical protein EYF80_046652 [Liparis tanakae]
MSKWSKRSKDSVVSACVKLRLTLMRWLANANSSSSSIPSLSMSASFQTFPSTVLGSFDFTISLLALAPRVEDLVVGGLVPDDDPLGVVDAFAGALAVAVAERAVRRAVERAALHHRVGPLVLLLAHQHHQAGDVVGQHVVHRLQQLQLQGLELVEMSPRLPMSSFFLFSFPNTAGISFFRALMM